MRCLDGKSILIGVWVLLSLLGCNCLAAATPGSTGDVQPPQGPGRRWENSVGHGPGADARLTGPPGPQDFTPVQTQCRIAEIAGGTPAALLHYLRSRSLECLKFLWSFDERLASVLREEHLRAAYRAVALQARKPMIDAVYLQKLLFFLRVAHYHAFYQQLKFPASVQRAGIQAFDALRPQVDRALAATTPDPWLHQWFNAVDGADMAHRYLPQLKHFLRAFVFVPEKLHEARQQRDAYSVLTVISRNIGNRSAAFLERVDADLIQLLTVLALKAELLDDADYVLNAAVWALGRIGPLPSFEGRIVRALEQITHAYGPTPASPSYRAPYLWVLQALDKYLRCPIGDIQVCKGELFDELEAELFPYHYSFDDGALIFETSLPLSQIQPLYHAAKQVHSQFSRVTSSLTPVKQDPNCILRVKIYGSKAAFSDYHWFLYDLPTNNGGIYIETAGVFYTFQRTPQQSRYSLEELFRHEFVHYLVGRYLIDGFWGRAPLYQRGRLVWFDEGFAEFLTWSSADEGVRVRRSLVAQVARDRSRMSVQQIMHARYGDFKFYRYAGLLFNYLYESEPAMLRQLLDLLRAGDADALDRLITRLNEDPRVETIYQRYLDDQVTQLSSLDDPRTFFPDLASLDLDEVSDIEAEFRRATRGSNSKCGVVAHTMNRRFACRDEMVGRLMDAQNYEAAWREFDQRLDETIAELESSSHANNFQAINCHLGPILFRHQRAGPVYPVAVSYCEGPLAKRTSVPVDPVIQLIRDFQQSAPGEGAACVMAPDGRLECRVSVSTSIYDAQISDQPLHEEMNSLVSEIENQVYAARPSVYGSLTCSTISDPVTVLVDDEDRYQEAEVSCVIELCPCTAVSVDPESMIFRL